MVHIVTASQSKQSVPRCLCKHESHVKLKGSVFSQNTACHLHRGGTVADGPVVSRQDTRADDFMQQPPRPTQILLFFTPNGPFQRGVLQLSYQKIVLSPHFFNLRGFSQFGL